jgi:monoamine oxidase
MQPGLVPLRQPLLTSRHSRKRLRIRLDPEFNRLSLEEKFAESRRSIERLHPGHGHELEKPIYVGWHRVPYNKGSWIATYGPGEVSYPGPLGTSYETLIAPDGPIYFVGDNVNHILG